MLGKILIPAFLFVSVSVLVNHVLFNYGQPVITVIESASGDSGSPGFYDTETSAEEDNTCCLLCTSLQNMIFVGSNLFSPHTTIPPELYLSIWLPPDKSF